MSNKDEALANFCAITGLGEGEAMGYLESTNWDLEAATNIFMAGEGGGADTGGGSTSAQPPIQEDDIRPPDAATEEQLIGGPPMMMMGGGLDAGPLANMLQAMASQLQDAGMGAAGPHRIVAGGGSGRAGRPQRKPKPPVGHETLGDELGKLFQPPEYNYHGTFDQAMASAKKHNKWLLVNLLGEDMQSLEYNRDVWGNSTVGSMVEAYFVFWQQYTTQPEAQKFMSLYPVNTAPFCGFIHPRTGELLDNWTGAKEKEQVHDKLLGFLDNCVPLQVGVDSPRHSPPTVSTAGNDGTSATSMDTSVNAEEDPELAAAIADSLRDLDSKSQQTTTSTTSTQPPATSSTASTGGPTGTAADPVPVDEDPEVKRRKVVEEWAPKVDLAACFPTGDAVAAAGPTTKIRLQLPSGVQTVVVTLNAPTQAIADFVCNVCEGARSRPITLRFGMPPKAVEPSMDVTVEAAGLKMEKVNVSWEE
eukprot:TRINITY_DN67467_c6_g1_i8.p1 TRINITY_DN67467_c6_g1~~TRINITY_DN67467_c6_g1_i8.p1  ORF type:complete len:489 (+),score=64.59 TRINITY_DN67467_c6_g1_i8:45-1469(+)